MGVPSLNQQAGEEKSGGAAVPSLQQACESTSESGRAAASPEAARARQAASGEVVVRFELPGGAAIEHGFLVGQTVTVLKAYLQTEHGVPMAGQRLYLDGNLMFDPLSLNDFPGVAGGGGRIAVRVETEGAAPAESKK